MMMMMMMLMKMKMKLIIVLAIIIVIAVLLLHSTHDDFATMKAMVPHFDSIQSIFITVITATSSNTTNTIIIIIIILFFFYKVHDFSAGDANIRVGSYLSVIFSTNIVALIFSVPSSVVIHLSLSCVLSMPQPEAPSM